VAPFFGPPCIAAQRCHLHGDDCLLNIDEDRRLLRLHLRHVLLREDTS